MLFIKTDREGGKLWRENALLRKTGQDVIALMNHAAGKVSAVSV